MKSSTLFLMVVLISTGVSEDLLKPGEMRTYTAQYTVKDADVCSDIINNATARAVDPCSKVVNAAQDTAIVHTTYNAAISLNKISDKSGKKVDAGDVITYTYYVANKGNVNLTNITITDDKIGTINYISGDNNNDGWLNLSDVWIYEGVYSVEEADLCSDIINTAEVTARDPCNRSITSSKDTEIVETSCREIICCEKVMNVKWIKSGKQTALSVGNGKAENNIKIISNQV